MGVAYRTADLSGREDFAAALHAATRWARRRGMRRATFLRAVVNVVPVRQANAAARESSATGRIPGVAVVDAAPTDHDSLELTCPPSPTGTPVPDYRVRYQ